MAISKELNRGRHPSFSMAFHLGFITKYRYQVLDRDAVDRLRLLFRKVCTDFES
jgi:putative transposase